MKMPRAVQVTDINSGLKLATQVDHKEQASERARGERERKRETCARTYVHRERERERERERVS